MGRLRRCLARGELGPLRELRLLEGEFLQVTRTGDPAGPLTVAIAASCPQLPAPDLLLLARPLPPSPQDPEELQLLGLFPLAAVRLSLWSRRRHRLRVLLASGRCFLVQLLAPPPRSPRLLFSRWLRLLFLLHAPNKGGGADGDTPIAR
ncbi:Golgi-associated RAB2 interactor protein 5A-like [Pezoporus occidentalis]|uniref:Golgi-associated RAB2 interactor protein 5A-like n=1 Tax=Pezoporus occidentalis TaxID=407982 RepID=UPI002F9129D2